MSFIIKKLTKLWQELIANLKYLHTPGKFSRWLIVGALLSASGLLGFLKLASELSERELAYFDHTFESWLFAMRSTWLTLIMRSITNLGSTVTIFAVMLLLIFSGLRRRRYLDVVALNVCVLGALD